MKPAVALFLPSLNGGGGERVSLVLAAALASSDVPTDLVLARSGGPLHADVPPGVRLVTLAARRVAWSMPKLVGYLRREEPEVMMATIANANVTAAVARRCAGVATRLVLRQGSPVRPPGGTREPWRERLLPSLVWRAYRWADLIVANARSISEELSVGMRGEGPEIRVLDNPIETGRLRRKAAADIDPADLPPGDADGTGSPLVVAAGRLTPQKDFATLLEALARVRRCGPPARLVILGEGPDRQELAGVIRHLGLASVVAMPGFRDNLPAFLARAHCFVMSSRWEGQPNALIEALALGCSPVATECPGATAELLGGGRFGRLVPVGDAGRMAEAIADTIRHPIAPELLRARAEEFSVERLLPRYLEALGLAAERARR